VIPYRNGDPRFGYKNRKSYEGSTMNTLRKTAMLALGALAVLASQVFFAAPGSGARAAAPDDVPRSIAPYFKTATSSPKAPDADGFLQRWQIGRASCRERV